MLSNLIVDMQETCVSAGEALMILFLPTPWSPTRRIQNTDVGQVAEVELSDHNIKTSMIKMKRRALLVTLKIWKLSARSTADAV